MGSLRTVILPSGFDLPFNWRHDLWCDTIEKFSGKVLYYPLGLQGRSRLLQYSGQKVGTKRSNMTAEEINMSWLTIVDEYSKQNLTDPNDKFIAISALASYSQDRYAEHLGMYCAGLWYNFLPQSLHLFVPNPNVLRLAPAIKRAPSWSWAAVEGVRLSMILTLDKRYVYHVKILHCETYLKFSSLPLGQITGGKLTIRGPLMELLWGIDKFPYEKSFSSPDPKDLGPKFGSGMSNCCEHIPIGKKNVLFLLLYSTDHEQTRSQGIILQPTDPNTFARIGFSHTSPKLGSFYKQLRS